VLLQPLPLPLPGLELARTNAATGELVQPGSQGSSTGPVVATPVNTASAAVPTSAVSAVAGTVLGSAEITYSPSLCLQWKATS
jgi:hypothetical protein